MEGNGLRQTGRRALGDRSGATRKMRTERLPRMAMYCVKGIQGPVEVKGQQYRTAVMQPWDKTLTDKQIGDVMTYERSEWGNNASPVTPEQIAAMRKELANHPESFSAPEILGAPDQDIPGGAPPAGGAPPKPGEA